MLVYIEVRAGDMRASDRAYAVLRGEIVDWRLAPGTVLAEVEQSTRIGVSRTPLRHALSRLVADGLVEPQGARGLVVAGVSAENVVSLFELRQALEQQSAALAARRRSVEPFAVLQSALRTAPVILGDPSADRQEYYDIVSRFDHEIDVAIDSPYLVAALDGVRTHLARIRRLSSDNPARLLEAAKEHLAIVDAIIDGDAQLAAHATHVHLHRSQQVILASLADAVGGRSHATRPDARAASSLQPTSNAQPTFNAQAAFDHQPEGTPSL
ncbi:GntR family transcriptional regulator [Subtercola frigoramans]